MNAFLIPKTQLLVVFFISFIISGCDLFQDQAIKQADQFILQKNIDKTNQDWKTSLPQPTTFTFSQDKAYLWH
jgi:peptidyl-prolyl cis-trans isomerase B (cyclophilin B)